MGFLWPEGDVIDFEYPQEFKDFLVKNGMKLKDDTKADMICNLAYGLWKEIQELKK